MDEEQQLDKLAVARERHTAARDACESGVQASYDGLQDCLENLRSTLNHRVPRMLETAIELGREEERHTPDPNREELEEMFEEARSSYESLRNAVVAIYFAAHWLPDRDVRNAKQLWARLRDAAEIAPDQSPEPRRGGKSARIQELEQTAQHLEIFLVDVCRREGRRAEEVRHLERSIRRSRDARIEELEAKLTQRSNHEHEIKVLAGQKTLLEEERRILLERCRELAKENRALRDANRAAVQQKNEAQSLLESGWGQLPAISHLRSHAGYRAALVLHFASVEEMHDARRTLHRIARHDEDNPPLEEPY